MTSTGHAEARIIEKVFAVSFGAFLGLTLLKFGNPPIMEEWVEAPTDFWEFLLAYPWPISWAYWMLALLAILGVAVILTRRRVAQPSQPSSLVTRHSSPPLWLVSLPVVWVAWQCLSATHSVD